MDNKLFVLADILKDCKDRKKLLDKEMKELNAQIEEYDLKLSDAMAEEDCDRFSHSGSTFYLNTRLFASPAAGRKDDMIKALKDAGFSDIVTETVNANTLASFVKEQKALNNDEIPSWLSKNISTHEKVSVGVRKG